MAKRDSRRSMKRSLFVEEMEQVHEIAANIHRSGPLNDDVPPPLLAFETHNPMGHIEIVKVLRVTPLWDELVGQGLDRESRCVGETKPVQNEGEFAQVGRLDVRINHIHDLRDPRGDLWVDILYSLLQEWEC